MLEHAKTVNFGGGARGPPWAVNARDFKLEIHFSFLFEENVTPTADPTGLSWVHTDDG